MNKYEVIASRAQQRLWYFEQKHPKKAVYHIPIELSIKGELNISLLWEAINEVIQCNEPLRTGLVEKDGRLYQIISEEIKLEETSEILSNQKEYDQLRQEIVEQPFDLGEAPLLRIRLFKLPTEYRLVVVFHHIIMDGWSINIFMNELSAVYNGLSRGNDQMPQMGDIQYADYAAWYEDWLDEGERVRSKVFWDKVFQDGYEKLEINYPIQQRIEDIFQSGYEDKQLRDSLAQKVDACISKGFGSIFSIFISAFLGTLSFITGKNRIMVETVTSITVTN